jgi:hypothetical protein
MKMNERGWTKGPDNHELYVEAMESKGPEPQPTTEAYVNPYDTPEYQQFISDMVKHCRCSHDRPCDGLLAGGLCDNIQRIEDDDPDQDDD